MNPMDATPSPAPHCTGVATPTNLPPLTAEPPRRPARVAIVAGIARGRCDLSHESGTS